jgi:zinc transport system ATP-binding protein
LDAAKETIVELHDVGVQYSGGVQALEHTTLQIFKGDFLGLIGPNGAGKSTLLGVILGLVKPNYGSVRLFGEPLSPKNLRRIGYVPQKAQVVDSNFPSNVFETVLMGRVPHAGLIRRLGKEDRTKVEEVLRLLEIYDLKDRKIGQLSGGQSQRVFTAKALVGDPELLIFDEPTSGVDTRARSEFYETLERLNRHLGITTILSSHDVGVVTKLASMVVCINRSLFYCGPTAEFSASSVFSKMYGYSHEVMDHRDHP